MKKPILTLLILIFLFLNVTSAYAWDDCPHGLVNDPYPGDCPRYIDTNNDQICDHSQPEPESQDSNSIDTQDKTTEILSTTSSTSSSVSTNSKSQNPYKPILPVVITALIYYFSYKKFKKANLLKFNFFWNTALLISAIPSIIFGFFLIIEFSSPALKQVNFDFLYWHVEGSIIFSTIVICHFIQRWNQYLCQIRSCKTKK